MSNPLRSLDRITIPEPCDADWDSMTGNDQVRFCEHCNLHVNDLSALSVHDAVRLLAESKGRLCVRFIRGASGRVISAPAARLYHIGRRASRIAAGAFSAALSVSSAAAQTPSIAKPIDQIELVQTKEERVPTFDEFSASLAGTIKTNEGSLVTDAIVVLVDRETGEERNLSATPEGEYAFNFLPAVDYLLWVRKRGLETSRNNVSMRPNGRQQLDVELGPRFAIMGGAMALYVEPESQLLKAISDNDITKVRSLAYAEPSLNSPKRFPEGSFLGEAIKRGNREIVGTLLDAGANVNLRSSNGDTPLMSLSETATVELVRGLIAAGAKVNARNNYGGSALSSAASSVSTEVLVEMFRAGARLNATDSSGQTALFAAARGNKVETIKFLIDGGVNVNAIDADGDTALTSAISLASVETLKTLIERGAEVNLKNDFESTPLMTAASIDDSAIAELLLSAGARVNERNRFGSTALMTAAEHGPAKTVTLLLNAGAEVDAQDNEGRTALHAAVKTGDAPTVAALLNAGANLTLKDREGKTALALAREKDDNDEVVRLLKARGAPE